MKRPRVPLLNLSGIGCRSTCKMAASKSGVAKNMRGVLRKWTPQDKYFEYQNFPTHFRLSLCLGMFWRNLTKIGHISIPYKFTQSGCIPPRIICEILAHKGYWTTHATLGDYVAS